MSKRQGTDLHHLNLSQSESTSGSRSFLRISSKLQKVGSSFLFFAKPIEFRGVFYDTVYNLARPELSYKLILNQ